MSDKGFRGFFWGLMMGIIGGCAILTVVFSVSNHLVNSSSVEAAYAGEAIPEFSFGLWPQPEFAPRPVWKGQEVEFDIAFKETPTGSITSLRIDCGDGAWKEVDPPELLYEHILVVEDIFCEAYQSPGTYTAVVEVQSDEKRRSASLEVDLDPLPEVMVEPNVENIDFGSITESYTSGKNFSFTNPTSEATEVEVLWQGAGKLHIRFAQDVKYSDDVVKGISAFEPPDSDSGKPGYECALGGSSVLDGYAENEMMIAFSGEDHKCFMEHRELTGQTRGFLRIDPGFVWDLDGKELSGSVMAGNLLYPDGASSTFEWAIDMQDKFFVSGGGNSLVPFIDFNLESGERWSTEVSFAPNGPGEVEQTMVFKVGGWERSILLSGVGVSDTSKGNSSSGGSSSGGSGSTPGIEGVVSSGGSPLAGAVVKIGSKPGIITGSDGRYGRDMDAGTYTVVASKTGCVTQSRNVTVNQSRVTVNFNLTC